MRFIMEPTQAGEARSQAPRVVIELPYDDVSIQEVGDMLRSLLLAAGFQPANVAELFGDEEATEETNET